MAVGQQVASLYARVTADVSGFEKAMKSVKSDMGALEKTTNVVGKGIKTGFAVGVAGVAAFGAAIGTTVKAAADMEQGVADIGAMMALTDADAQRLGDHIMELGLDPNLKVSATEASAAVMALGTAGLQMSQIMGGASKATVLLANATGLSGGAGLASAANIASDVMQQFNITAGDMDRAVNQIAGTTVASKFSIDDYRLAIAQAGGVAGSVGLSFEDFNAIIAATSSSFASGSDAGTSLKTFLQRLVPTTNTAKDAMAELGLITEDGTSKFFTASGAMRSAEEIAGILSTAFSGLSDAQKIEAASTIFGTDAMRTALGIAAGGIPVIQAMKGEIGKVDAEELAAKRMDTFKGSMEILWGIIETLSISIGQKFIPVLRPLIETFSELAQTYGPSIVKFFGDVATTMAAWIERTREAVGKGLGPMVEKLQMIWERGTQVIGVITQFVGSVLSTLMPVTSFIMKTMNLNDLLVALGILLAGPVLAAIGGLIAALWPVITTIALITAAVTALRFTWQNDFMGIRTFTKNTLDKLTQWFYTESGLWHGSWERTMQHFKKWAQGGWKTDILIPLQGHFLVLKSTIFAWANATKERFSSWVNQTKHDFLGWVSDILHRFNSWRTDVAETIRHWASVTGDAIGHWIALRKQDVKMFVTEWSMKFKEWKDDILERLEQIFSWFKPNEWLQKGRDILQGLWDGAKEVWQRFKDWWSGIWKTLTGTVDVRLDIGSPSKEMMKRGAWAVEGFAKGAQAALPLVDNAMNGLAAGAMGAPFAGGGGGSSTPAVSTSRMEQLLEILIAELRSKNMNVTVQGGANSGTDYGALVGFKAGAR